MGSSIILPRRALLAAATLSGCARPARADAGLFGLGVGSGDPWPDGVVLWTRLAPEPLAPLGGMAPDRVVEVGWEVAADDGFARILRRGTTSTDASQGFAVHVEVTGLPAGRHHWYRFHAAGEVSPTGRTRTAPAVTATPPRIRFINAGCQHYEHGFFTAWRHVAAEEELDFVFHYGDYIYEQAGRRPGQRGGFGPVVRSIAGGKCRTLEDYRQRYAQYHADADLQAAHAAHPFVHSFDDHEVENNWAGAESEADGRSARHPVALPQAEFLAMRAAAFQAWYENMPVRAGQKPRGPDVVAHRRLRFGRLLDLHVLDTRQYRDDQPCGDGVQQPCGAQARPEAQMLGLAQEAWLLANLRRAPNTWQVLAQQVVMMRRQYPSGGFSMDAWDGYPAARRRLLQGLQARDIANAVVLSGDTHTAWAGDLRLDPEAADSPVIATEFVGTSITSLGDGTEVRAETAAMLQGNPHIRFFNARRGYTLHEAQESRMEVTFRAVPYVTRPGAPLEDRGRFVVEAGRPGVTPA